MRCRMRDEGGPLEAGLQGQASSHPKLLGSRALVVSVRGKGAARLRQARIRKTNASKPLMTCRKRRDDVETRPESLAWDKAQGEPAYGLGGVRHEGGVILIQALVRNVGTCRLDGKGRNSSGGPARMRVPMRGTGTEQPIVATKSAKADGAKGLCYPAEIADQPEDGRSR